MKINEGVIATVGTKITAEIIPVNSPVVYLTRDVWNTGEPRAVVDVWVGRPRRDKDLAGIGVVFTAHYEDTYCGAFTDAAVRERFGIVPGPDECIVIDNERVS